MLGLGSEKGASSDAVDVIIEIIRCFGLLLQDAEKQALQKSIMAILDDGRTVPVIKKKAVVAMSILAMYLSDRLLSGFVSNTVETFRDPHLALSQRRMLITMLGSLSRSVPQRLGPHLKTLAPFVLSALSYQELMETMEEMAEYGASKDVEDVREAALVALEGFLSTCSNDMRIFTTEAIEGALRYVVYDPYTANDEDDEEMGGTRRDEDDDDNLEMDGFEQDDQGFEEEGVLSDDDDTSWKIRRCAAKALYAIVTTRSNGDLLDNGTLYEKVAPVLISRFKEREENVRLEMLATLSSLVRKTGEGAALLESSHDQDNGLSGGNAQRSRKRRRVDSNTEAFDTPSDFTSSTGLISPVPSPSPVSGPRADLARVSTPIVKGVAKLLKQASIPTKQAAITLLRDVVLVQSGGLSDNLSNIVESLVDAVKSKGTSSSGSVSSSVGGITATTGSKMRIDALQLVGAICDTHSSKILAPHVEKIVPEIVLAVNDKYYKVSSEALLTVESIVKVLTPPRSAGTEQQRQSYLGKIYNAIYARAMSTDADLEVRQRAIHSLGVLLARTSGAGNAKLLTVEDRTNALTVLQDRLRNETTRVSAVKAVDLVVASAVDQGDLQLPWIRQVTLELAAQLRKADRTLRGASLTALKNLVYNSVALASLEDETVHSLAGMLLPLLTSADLSLLGLAMAVLTKLVKRSPEKVVDSSLNTAMCVVVLAPLGGAVFEAFLGLVKVIGEQAVGQPLMQGFLQNVGVSGDPAVVGKAIGTLLISGGSTLDVGIGDFTMELQSSEDPQRKCLALSILGEAGLRLGSSSPLVPQLFTAHFNSKSENVPRAAAIALGRAGAGNISTFLPVILSYSDKAGHLQYLSLHSIKEILHYAGISRSDMSPYTKEIWEKLIVASQAEDNKIIGAECIGRITNIEPKTFLPLLLVRFHMLCSMKLILANGSLLEISERCGACSERNDYPSYPLHLCR